MDKKLNDPVRIGMIGLGMRSFLARYWHQPGGRSIIAGAADLRPEALDAFGQEFGSRENMQLTTDYQELLANPEIDAVAITSPDYCHEEQAIAALKAGKDVFCEKPLAITIEGCDRILEAWKASGKRLMIGFNMRYMNMFRTMKSIVDSGTIGEIKAVWVRHFVGHGGDYYYHDWHAERSKSTSLLLQKGSHDIDIIHWITGRYTKRVSAFGSLDYFGGDAPNDLTCPQCEQKRTCPEAQFNERTQCAFRQEVDVEDNNMVIMELEGGIKASYLQCHFTPDYHRNYVFIGTEGRMENSEPDGKVWVKTRKSGRWRDLSDQTYDIKTAEGTHGGADPVICEEFLDMIQYGVEPVAHPLAGRMSVATGCAAAASMRSGGQPIDIPPLADELMAFAGGKASVSPTA